MADCDEFEIVNNPKGKASIWKHFGNMKNKRTQRIEDNVAGCFTCKAKVKCSGGTTNLTSHLRRHRPLLITPTASPHARKIKTESLSTASTPTVTTQQTLPHVLTTTKNYPSTPAKAVRITGKVARFLIGNMRPYSVVESEEFRALLTECDSRYQIPSRKTFSEVIIPKLYHEVSEEEKASLRNSEMINIQGTDGWTSRACESFMTITSAHITNDWKLRSYVLQTRALPESHTGDHIAEVLSEAVREWEIPVQNTAPLNPPIVTDNASNMVKAGKIFNTTARVMCYAHTMNLAAQKCLKVKEVALLLAKMRKTVAFFHHSNVATHLLKVKAEALSLPQHKLTIDVCTRWNSTYDMVSRFLEMQVGVFAVLRSKEVAKGKESDLRSFPDEDLSLADDMVQLLKVENRSCKTCQIHPTRSTSKS